MEGKPFVKKLNNQQYQDDERIVYDLYELKNFSVSPFYCIQIAKTQECDCNGRFGITLKLFACIPYEKKDKTYGIRECVFTLQLARVTIENEQALADYVTDQLQTFKPGHAPEIKCYTKKPKQEAKTLTQAIVKSLKSNPKYMPLGMWVGKANCGITRYVPLPYNYNNSIQTADMFFDAFLPADLFKKKAEKNYTDTRAMSSQFVSDRVTKAYTATTT